MEAYCLCKPGWPTLVAWNYFLKDSNPNPLSHHHVEIFSLVLLVRDLDQNPRVSGFLRFSYCVDSHRKTSSVRAAVALPWICSYWFQGDAHLGRESAQLLRSHYDIMNIIIKSVGTVAPAKINFQNVNSLSHEVKSVTASRWECLAC